MFRHWVGRVTANVTNGDAALAAVLEIDAVRAGGGDGDQFHVRSVFKLGIAQAQLVADDDSRWARAFGHLLRKSFRIFSPFMIQIRAAKVRLNRIALEKDYSF